jgi:hypothetical protein
VKRRTLVLLVAVPALLCAVIGLTHPPHLNAASAEHWRNMHIALIPIFPLVSLAPWLLARRAGTWFGRAGAVLGYGFAVFYTSLDLLAGVAGGALVASGHSDATGPIFAVARVLGSIGVVALVLGCLLAGFAAFSVAGLATLPGALLATVGAVLVQPGHIYLGLGTVAMLLLAGGFVIMAVAVTTPKAAA